MSTYIIIQKYKNKLVYLFNKNLFYKSIGISFILLLILILVRETIMLTHNESIVIVPVINYITTRLYFIIYIGLSISIFIHAWLFFSNLYHRKIIYPIAFNFSAIFIILFITIIINIFGGYIWKLTLENNNNKNVEFTFSIEPNKFLVPAKTTKILYFNSTSHYCPGNESICIGNTCLSLDHGSCGGFLGGEVRNIKYSSTETKEKGFLIKVLE